MRLTGTTLSLIVLTGLFWSLVYLSKDSDYDQNYAYFAYAALLSVGTFILHYRSVNRLKADTPFGKAIWFTTLLLGSPLTVVLLLCLNV